MNNSESAKRGFRTFILTLSISLIVFSAVYYALTTYNAGSKSGEGQPVVTGELGANSVIGEDSSPDVQSAEDERTVFGEIISKKPEVQVQEVLAGATSAPQTTQSTTSVPVTGFTEMTIGLLLSLVLFTGAMVYNLINPRKFALSSFEKKLLGKSK
jgi:hypothetical protein